MWRQHSDHLKKSYKSALFLYFYICFLNIIVKKEIEECKSSVHVECRESLHEFQRLFLDNKRYQRLNVKGLELNQSRGEWYNGQSLSGTQWPTQSHNDNHRPSRKDIRAGTDFASTRACVRAWGGIRLVLFPLMCALNEQLFSSQPLLLLFIREIPHASAVKAHPLMICVHGCVGRAQSIFLYARDLRQW